MVSMYIMMIRRYKNANTHIQSLAFQWRRMLPPDTCSIRLLFRLCHQTQSHIYLCTLYTTSYLARKCGSARYALCVCVYVVYDWWMLCIEKELTQRLLFKLKYYNIVVLICAVVLWNICSIVFWNMSLEC